MIRTFNIILLFSSLLVLAGVYTLKYQTETLDDERAQIVQDIKRQQTNLSVLRADWAYLTQPSYIEPLVTRHAEALNLQIIAAEQIASIDDIPMRPSRPNSDELTALLLALESGNDPIGDAIGALTTE